MNTVLDLEKLAKINISFQTGFDPPPYSYTYNLSVGFSDGEFPCTFQLNYTDREGLSEEEILEEGFSLNDDFNWTGKLPKVWIQQLLSILKKTTWKAEVTETNSLGNQLHISIEDTEGNNIEGEPAKASTWEYLMQEIIQAIYELSKKENPLLLQVKYSTKTEINRYILEGFFSDRQAQLTKETSSKSKIVKELSWNNLNIILKSFYAVDFENLQSYEEEPENKGIFISPGDGYWYKLNYENDRSTMKNQIIDILESFLKERY